MPISPEEEQRAEFWRAVRHVTERVTAVESTVEQRAHIMRDTIHEAVKDAMPRALLTDKQHQWVELAIEREAQSIRLRRAIIEKTLHGLVWAAIVGIGFAVREYAIAHGMWKP